MPFLPRPQKLKGMVGDKGFDPLGLSDWVPVEWLRESELKHGRIAMFGFIGTPRMRCRMWDVGCSHRLYGCIGYMATRRVKAQG